MPSPNTCIITGSVKNLLGSAVQNCNLTVSVLTPFFHPTGDVWISGQLGSTTTNSSGDFSITVVETETPGVKINFTFDYFDGISGRRTKRYSVVVPDTATAILADLVTADVDPVTSHTFPATNVTVQAITNLSADNAQDAFSEIQGDINTLNTEVAGLISSTLTDSHIYVGSSTNVATDRAVTGDIGITNTGVTSISSGVVVNADVNASAAIAYSKLAALTAASVLVGNSSNVATVTAITGDIGIDSSGVTSISSGVIVNADVNASAAIAYSKLNLSGGIVNADVNASAAIAYSKLALTGAILNADLAGSIADTKLLTISTAGKVSNSATTATAANTASAIVARDSGGAFSMGALTVNSTLAANVLAMIGGASATFPNWHWYITNDGNSTLTLDNDHTSLIPFACHSIGTVGMGVAPSSTGPKLAIAGHAGGMVISLKNNASSPDNALTHYASDGSTILSSISSAGLITAANIVDSGLTASQAVVTDSGKQLTSLSYVSAATASTLVSRDSSANTRVNNLIENYATVATAAGTTTLTVGSAKTQFFTGSTTQSVQLPAASTLVLGTQFDITNNSSGAVTVKDAGSNTVQVMAASSHTIVTVTDVGSSNGVWNSEYAVNNAGAGTVTSVALTVPSGLAIAGSPVTSSGTLAITASGQFAASQMPAFTGDITTSAGAVATTAAATQANIVTLSKSTGVAVHGTSTNDSAAAGYMGEFISANTGSNVALASSNTYVTLASVSLTAGDWDVYGTATISPGGTTACTLIGAAISLTTNAADSVTSGGFYGVNAALLVAVNSTIVTGPRRISLSTTTTVYITGRAVYTVGGGAVWTTDCFIGARRVR